MTGHRQYPPSVSYLIVTVQSVALLAMQTTLPFKLKALGGDLGAVGFLYMWSSLWYVVAGVSLGWLSHRFGPRRIMLTTLLVCAAMPLGMTGVGAIWQLYILLSLYSISLCVFWAATEHASTGLHAHLTLAQSTAIFSVSFCVGNALGILVSTTMQGETMIVPLLISGGLSLAVFALTWITVAPHAGHAPTSPTSQPAWPERTRQSLIITRTGMVGVYGAYALVSLFLPRYLWEHRGYSKPGAGAVTSLMLLAMAGTFAVHGWKTGWMHRLGWVRLCPFVAGGAVLAVGLTGQPFWIGLGALIIGVTAGIAYMHNLYYSLEDPAHRARNAGIHEALVGAAFMVPPALGGLASRWTTMPETIFWVGAGFAFSAGLLQNWLAVTKR